MNQPSSRFSFDDHDMITDKINNKGIRDARSTADFRILFEILKIKNLENLEKFLKFRKFRIFLENSGNLEKIEIFWKFLKKFKI